MDDEKLKPCPFCGGEARITYGATRNTVDGKPVKGECVYCENCFVSIFYISQGMAAKAWNRRAE